MSAVLYPLRHNAPTPAAASAMVLVTNATTFRFGPCELDEARRSLFAHGQEIKLQPRVFDVLCYLVRHRERVVPKDELLDALWPGSVVVDNALQRVVSLARAALAEVGLGEAVRTYPRHGYRFCLDDCIEPVTVEGVIAPTSGLDDARAAVERSDWLAACEAYAAADVRSALLPEDVEQWARAAICAGLGPSVVAALERAVAQSDAAGDVLAAARATLLLVQIRIDHKQGVLARGLLQRASRYLEGQAESTERGHFAWMASRMAIGNGDPGEALAMANEACQLGRSLREPDVECLGLVYRGHALMAQGEVVAGLAQHEEAAAVIRLGGVRSWVAGWALCSILYAARHRCDWLRAAQFAEAFVEWSRASQMPAFPGTCQLHRAAVLGVQGDLERAASEVRAAASLLARAAPWAEGDAYCVLGDIQISHGDFDGAEASFRQAHALGWDPQPGLARLHLLTGRAELARRELERALEETDWTLRERRGQLLCLLVHAAVLVGDAERARLALRTLATDPQMLPTDALKAMHCGAEAELALHDHEFKLAAQKLRQAVRHWLELNSPLGEAEARLRLAECLLLDGDTVGCEMELHALDSKRVAVALPHRARIDALRAGLAR
ncbi:winged helix-turn-helix domain-containing protein [Sphaerotilaceae bacterium SBD11-9]